jgi:hypothetical protein
VVSYGALEELGRASIRYFALAIGDDNPLYGRRGLRSQGWLSLDNRTADPGL